MPYFIQRKRPLIFAIPGGKVYIGDSCRNTRGSFINISITGSGCQLQCRHCQGELLKGMTTAAGSRELISVTEKYIKRGGLKGMLISGGFDRDGRLAFAPVLDGISKIKKKYPGLTVYMHTGFLQEEEARSLKETGLDAVLVNLIKSKKAIEEVYNLKGKTYEDYLETIRVIRGSGLKVSPHIIIGLENGHISDEFQMVEDALSLGVDSIVFALLKKASRKIDFPASSIADDEIIRLVEHARSLSPETLLSFGCARPPGRNRYILEIGLINAGIDSIAYPSDGTVRYAIENKLAHTFIEKCCANL